MITRLIADTGHSVGAPPAGVVCQVVARGAMLIGGGIVVGLAGALALARVLGTMLYGVRPTDAGIVGTALAVVLLMGLVGCLGPASRASRVDVVAALRHE